MKYPVTEKVLADAGISEYDRALILGNRLAINKALQELSGALRNLKGANSDVVLEQVKKVEQADALLREYNGSMVDLGIS